MNDLSPITSALSVPASLAGRSAVAQRSEHIAPDCSGLNFFAIDQSLRDLLGLYMDGPLLAHLTRHLNELGELAGGRLNRLADLADKHPPVLHRRDRFGRDEEWIEVHPAYDENRRIAFARFGMHAMTHRPGVLGWHDRMPILAKQAFFYLAHQEIEWVNPMGNAA